MALKLSLTKKSDAQLATAPLWHPNFRNFERLPDTKVVRTAFFVNAGAIFVSLCLLLWLGYREYHIYSLNKEIVAAQREIDSKSQQNKEALRLSRLFADEEKKLTEAATFTRLLMVPSEFVVILGQTLPKEIALETVDMRLSETAGPICVLRGLVSGTPDQASGTASSYIEQLHGQPRFASTFESINLTSLTRDPKTGFLIFEVVFKIKNDAKEKKS